MRVLTALALVMASALSASVAQFPPRPDRFLVTVPPEVDTSHCHVRYRLTTRSVFNLVNLSRPTEWSQTFPIDIYHDGVLGESLRVVLHCLGYQVALLSFPSLGADIPPLDLELKPLGTVTFVGRISGPRPDMEPLEVLATYLPWWRCEYLDVADCGMGGHYAASADVQTDGSFAIELPDYLADPMIGRFSPRGDFGFSIRNRETGESDRLLPVFPETPSGRITEQASYPGERQFRIGPR